MGKKSLTKSTSKKKRAPKKTAASPRKAKKAPAKKTSTKAKKTTSKKAAPKTAPVTVKNLLKKKFDIVVPEKLYSVPEKLATKSTFTEPAFLAGFEAKDAERIKGLIANTYSEKDLTAAAEKAAAEKAAAEKAAAEKAAAEKAAAEKAAAEKAAAEKAAEIIKSAAQKSEVSVSYDSASEKSTVKEPADPIDTSIKLFAAGLAFLILLVIGASTSNSFKYYLNENQGALEVWKGKFAPLGEKLIIALPGVPAPESPKEVYKSDDVYPMVFTYYIEKADALLDVSGIPDFEGIKNTLKTALEYGSTQDLREQAYQRLDNIDRLVLIYKADVAASKGTIEDLESAIGFLNDAGKLTLEKNQEALIAQKIATHKAAITDLEAAAEKEAAEKEAAEKAEAEAAEAAEETEAENAVETTSDKETTSEDEAAEKAPASETEEH